MTVSSTTTKNSYSGDGSQTVFAYTFKIFDDDDITVIVRSSAGTETTQTKTTHYSVSGVGDAGGGNITFTTAPASGETVVLLRDTALTQTTDYTPNDPFPASAHEDALDRITFQAQEIQEELDRAIKVSRTNTLTSSEFTVDATTRANKIFAFDSDGDLAVTQEIGTFQGTDATITTEAYKERDLIKSTTAAELNNVYICVADSVVGDLLTNTDHFELVVDAVSAATSATNAAASATTASGHASTAETHKNDAETAKTGAETAETNAQGHEDTAQDWAVKTNGEAQTGEGYSSKAWAIGGTGVTDASGSGSAKEWATDTTNTCDGTEYSAKEYAIGTQSGNTNGSAKQWAIGGGNSFSTNTTVDGTNYSAKYWAEQAAASVDSFDDTYLGAKSSDPTVDNDGDALTAGDLYFNTGTNRLRVYDGANWNDAVVDTTGFATAGFSIAMSIAL